MNVDNLHAGEEKTELQDSAQDNRLPKDVLVQWPGRLARFSRALEGGPGTPRTLIIMAALATVHIVLAFRYSM